MNNLILHIPHSSKKIPAEYLHEYTDKEELEETILKLTDTYTDELFDVDSSCCTKVIFPFSRVFCDVERFNDEREEMLQYGQGVIYTHGINGKRFRELSDNSVSDIIENYYEKHKSNFTEKVRQVKNPIIVDCHSFSDEICKMDPFNPCDLPDICIGYNTGDVKAQAIACFLMDYLEKLGFIKTLLNIPFSGSYQIDNVTSVMIEINRKLYLMDDCLTKKSDFYKAKFLMKVLIEKIRSYDK